MSKRLLYLEDLYNFYSNYKKSTHFSSENKEPIVVQVGGKLEFDSNNNDEEGLCKVHLQACHTELNVNQSYIEKSIMEKALPSFKNRPILGYIHTVNGQPEFYSHNMHMEDDEVVYDEVPVGIIPESCNAQIVYDEEKDKSYVEIDGYIFEEYSKAKEILERESECFVSVELAIRELSYNAKDKYLNIEDFFFSGVTILGKTPEGENVQPGMQGSNIKLADFSESKNSLFANKLDSLTSKVDLLLSRFDTYKNSKEGGNDSQMSKFEELLNKYNKTVEDIDFDYESMSDEELEAKFAELFDEEGEEESEETLEEDTPAPLDLGDEDGVPPTSEEPATGEDEEEVAVDTNDEIKKKQYSTIKGYELSHDDIRYALYNLLASYEEADNEWYFIENVYDNHFVYSNWSGEKVYGQNYSKDGDNVSFDGERFSLHRELLTDAEYVELQSMRANYAALVEFKETIEKNELHAQRESILSNERYSSISEKDKDGNFVNKDFAKLYSEMDNYSLEELEKEVKVIFADNVNIENFSAKENKNSIKVFANVNKNKKDSRYGNLFSGK
ncbi:MAG: hypothetical protein KBT35_01560 [Firmicutes bacterium]|nr:hypothetical protein [Candidatus Colivicinus equi]